MNIFRRNPNLYLVLAVVVFSIAVIVFVSPVSAGGATQIAGIGYFADTTPVTGECIDIPLVDTTDPAGPHYAIKLEGDLVGCNYITVLYAAASPSGTYREWGTEHYIITEYDGTPVVGTFETTYLATVKWDDEGGEIWGRCQHPIVKDSGTGFFEGVTGRLDYKDNVSEGVLIDADYRGHLRW